MSDERAQAVGGAIRDVLADDWQWMTPEEWTVHILEAADAVTFSDEALERVARVLCEQLWENAHESQKRSALQEAREVFEALGYTAEPRAISSAMREP